MESLKLYRLLQAHVGKLNHLVVSLYKEEITVEKALEEAGIEVNNLQETLNADKE